MVHALKQVHRLLRPDGRLIEVHDLPVPHRIEVHSGDSALKAGWLIDGEDFRRERSALNAITQVVAEELFLLENEQDFEFNVYLESVPELQKWLADGWETAVIPESTIRRLGQLFVEATQAARIVLKVPTRMICLRVR